MQTPEKRTVRTQGNAHAEPVKLLKRIGPTTVEVTVHFSKTGNETMADIVRRLLPRDIKNDVMIPFAAGEREVDKVA